MRRECGKHFIEKMLADIERSHKWNICLGTMIFWSRLMKVKSDFLRLGKFKIGDGTQVRLF
jgi:hypothetical protein